VFADTMDGDTVTARKNLLMGDSVALQPGDMVQLRNLSATIPCQLALNIVGEDMLMPAYIKSREKELHKMNAHIEKQKKENKEMAKKDKETGAGTGAAAGTGASAAAGSGAAADAGHSVVSSVSATSALRVKEYTAGAAARAMLDYFVHPYAAYLARNIEACHGSSDAKARHAASRRAVEQFYTAVYALQPIDAVMGWLARALGVNVHSDGEAQWKTAAQETLKLRIANARSEMESKSTADAVQAVIRTRVDAALHGVRTLSYPRHALSVCSTYVCVCVCVSLLTDVRVVLLLLCSSVTTDPIS
jgi:hypothetical protein